MLVYVLHIYNKLLKVFGKSLAFKSAKIFRTLFTQQFTIGS